VEERLKQLLAGRQKVPITNSDRTRAAVLVPLFRKEGEWHLLFIKRTEMVKVHKGQISFPGGVCEARDSTLLNTALREAGEEIGLAAEDIQVLGELDDQESVTTNFLITPFPAVIPYPYDFQLDRYEVHKLLEVPIATLLAQNDQPGETTTYRKINYTYRCEGEVI
jgi:8-oxo-dGTP pyrophosphatase MutT (NUDIX family)